jgi:hypothetical protein
MPIFQPEIDQIVAKLLATLDSKGAAETLTAQRRPRRSRQTHKAQQTRGHIDEFWGLVPS